MAYGYPTDQPPSYGRVPELTTVAEAALRQSGIGAGHKLVIYADTRRTRDQINAFFTAGLLLGAETVVLMSPARIHPTRVPLELSSTLMRAAETVIDLASVSWIYAKAFSELLDKNVRILSSMSNPDTWMKMPPRDDIAATARAGGEMIQAASEVRVTSEAGTDLRLAKGDRRGIFQEGLVQAPGEWDNFPSAQAACAPLERNGEGKLVVSPGDMLVQLQRIVSDRIEITLKDSRIVDISGGADAALLRSWFSQWGDQSSYVTSHIGFGLEPRADVSSMQMMEWESFGGGVMIAFGANDGRFLGGANAARSHMDIVLLNHTFALDGQTVLEGGNYVHPELKVQVDKGGGYA